MNCALPVCRSSFSLLYGTAGPEELVQAIAGAGHNTFLLADYNNLYGCYDAYYAALDIGIKPMIGATLSTEIGTLLLICQNHGGFKNLSRLITEYQLNGNLSCDLLGKLRDNIICLAGMEAISKLKDIFGDNLYVQIDYNGPSHAYRMAHQAGLKVAACPPVSFPIKDDYRTHCLLRAIEGGYILDNMPSAALADENEYLRDSDWYSEFYSLYPDALNGSRELIESSQLIFPERKNILPDIRIEGDHFEKLKNDAVKGLKKRQPACGGKYLSRLKYELSVIKRTGFVDYFLIVGEIVDYCREKNIAAVGRGSAAGSLVSYSLGITEVDPVAEGLYFERFLNEARSDCPDIDLDIDWRRRDEVLEFVYDKYGREHVAMMATYTRFQPRLAIRETARAFGFSPDEINTFVKAIPRTDLSELTAKRHPIPMTLKNKLNWNRFEPVLQMARRLSGLPRHLGIHSGGIVITPEPLTNYIPLERATKGIVVTQCDMYQAEKIGLVKIDILGQRGLAVIADCYEAVRKMRGDDFIVPMNDQKTFRMLQSGRTIGVFQIESPGLRALLRDLKPQRLNDITLALALIRPGASESGMKKIFLQRFHGLEKTAYPHRNLERILEETYGVFIYQEQVILAAQQIAGFNLPASDLLRRAITKKRKKYEQKKLEKRFLDGAAKCGIERNTAANILAQLRQFASFGFCKAHAATYGCLALQSAYFKAHYPDIFMTAVLRNGGGYYPASVYVSEARRLGMPIMPPDVNLSEDHDSLCAGRIYLGLNRVKDITGRAVEQIMKNRPFAGFDDFLSRIDISEYEVEQLIRVGFFDSLETSRAALFWRYRLFGQKDSRTKNSLFGAGVSIPRMKSMPPLVPISRYEIFRAECDILDLNASFHPLTLFPDFENINLSEIHKLPDKSPVSVAGWRADIKRIRTRNGRAMVFLTFDTLDDTFEVILFPDTYARYSDTIRAGRYLEVEGILNREEGNPVIVAQRISSAATGLKEAPRI